MRSWLLASFLLGVWCLWAVAAVAQRAAEGARRGIPEEQWGGVSVFPIIPVFPVVLWGIAWLIDLVHISPWGTWFIGAAHGGFAVCLIISIALNWWCPRSLERATRRDR